MAEIFKTGIPSVVEGLNAGLFVSSGAWIHTTRRIDSYELILVNEGIVEMFEEKETFKAGPGEMLLLYPRRIHGGLEIFRGKLSFYWLHFRMRDLHLKEAPHLLELPQHSKPAVPEHLSILFREYLTEQEKGNLSTLKNELLILQILYEAACSPQITENANIIAGQVFRFIAEHYQEPISTALIARELRRNPDYLGRCFKKTYERTITDEINRRRLGRAEKFLIDSDLNLNEIAAFSGFNDPGYFRKLFMRKNGTTPGKFRKGLSRVYINVI